MERRQFVKSLAAVGATAALPGLGQAQEQWPTRNVTMVVPFPPGGQADLAARPIAEAMRRILGQSVVVENRAGAGGKTGNAAVARATPDGYTLLMTLASMLVLPEADRLFARQVAYEVADLRPIARVLADPVMIAVRADAPWKTLADLAEDARKRPGTIPFSSSGSYGALHVPIEMFATAAGVKFLHVPFTGGGPAVNALLQGTVQITAGGPGVVKPHVDAGTVRILGNTGNERVAGFMDVPTCQEAGYKDVSFYIWAGLFAPLKTPEPVVTKLRLAMKEAMADKQIAGIFEKGGSPPAYLDEPEFKAFVEADHKRLVKAVQAIGKVE